MINPEEAAHIISSHPFIPEEEKINVHQSAWRILAENIHADSDLPPFDRVMMDGVAIRMEDWNKGIRDYKITGIQRAGIAAISLDGEGTCVEVMTGAICPENATVIIPYEECEIKENRCLVLSQTAKERQHIHAKGSDKKKNDVLISSNTVMSAAEIGVAVSVGYQEINVLSLPKVHIFSTGDELVETSVTPLPFQIRRSNVYVLQELLKQHGITASESHVSDDKTSIKLVLEKAMEHNDVILLSGGVSKGKFDFLPEVLEELSVKKGFHRIAQKPGKPMWFGAKERTIVFAFPGNPVSTVMCAVRYLIPWLNMSLAKNNAPTRHAQLAKPTENKTGLTFYLQVKTLWNDRATLTATPIMGNGSGDFSNLTEADGFLELPPGPRLFNEGEIFPFYAYR